jgi:hypothetical protein
MAVRNVSVTARQETFGQTYGVVTYRFAWTNFAATGDGTLEIGDALDGLFLDSETSLTVRWPATYQPGTVTPEPDDRTNTSVTWRGQQQFGTDEPRVVAIEGGASESGGLDPLVLGVALVGLTVLAAAAFLARRRLAGGGGDGPDDGDTQTATDDGDTDATAQAEAAPPDDLLSNEEQVLRLLERNGGRIKQQAVASELEWTDAKTSQVIGGLRDDDRVETFRIGRENVVTLPDVDVTDAE